MGIIIFSSTVAGQEIENKKWEQSVGRSAPSGSGIKFSLSQHDMLLSCFVYMFKLSSRC